MGKPVFEEASGTKDGVNRIFTTSATYTPTSLFAFFNGQLQQKEWVTELGGLTFQVAEAPNASDELQIRYVTVV